MPALHTTDFKTRSCDMFFSSIYYSFIYFMLVLNFKIKISFLILFYFHSFNFLYYSILYLFILEFVDLFTYMHILVKKKYETYNVIFLFTIDLNK